MKPFLRNMARLVRRSAAGAEAGISLVEVTVVLSVAAMLAAVLSPSVLGYVDQARRARAQADTQVIGEAILDFIDDNAERQFLKVANGTGRIPPSRPDSNRVNLLVSDGDTPSMSAALAETFWTQAVNSGTVDTLANHLILNTPGGLAANRYRTPTDVTVSTTGNIDFARGESSGFNAPNAWRGAYLRGPVRSDPWGNRYAVNVAFLDPSPVDAFTAGIITTGFTVSDYARLDVFVLSAGADKEIDTKSAQDGAVPGDDDFIFVVSANAK